MRVLHAAALLRPSPGIINQMKWEQRAADELGLDWQVRMFCPTGWVASDDVIQASARVVFKSENSSLHQRARSWISLRRDYYRWLKNLEDSVDVYVLRHYVHDPFQAAFIANSAKPVYLMHHTLEVPELYGAGGILGRARGLLERFIGNYSIRKSNCTIGVTREIVEYESNRVGQVGRPSIQYPNGVIFDGNSLEDRRSNVPTFLFVASFFSDWHGLDLLLKQINLSENLFKLHIVGELSIADQAVAETDSRVVLHGKKNASYIRTLSEECWVGLSSFALDRKGMTEACPLKVREYLSLGLPVYAGHKDVFPDEFPFFRSGLCNIAQLLDFASEVRMTQFSDVAKTSRPYIDKKILLHDLTQAISQVYKA